MSDVTTNVLNVSAVTVTGDGGAVDTLRGVSGGAQTPQFSPIDSARFYLNVATLTGTGPLADVTIVATVNSIEHVIGTFTQASGATSEFIDVSSCPGVITAKYALTGTAVTNFTATLACIRLYSK